MDRTEKPAIITRMAECLHHGERLVAPADVSIMICPLQFLPGFPGFESIPDPLRAISVATLSNSSCTSSPRSRSTISKLSISSIARKQAYHPAHQGGELPG